MPTVASLNNEMQVWVMITTALKSLACVEWIRSITASNFQEFNLGCNLMHFF